MNIHKLSLGIPSFLLIIICIIPSSYQQYVLIGDNLNYYSQAHKMPNTIDRFWHDVNVDCKVDTTRLIEIYIQLMKISEMEVDQFVDLLRHRIKRTIMHEIHTNLIAIFFTKSVRNDLNLKVGNYLKALYDNDKRLVETVMEMSINKVYLFLDHEDFIRKMVRLNLDDVQIVAVEKVLDKYLPDKSKTKVLPILAYYITNVYKKRLPCISCNERLNADYERIPKELRLLYESTDQTIVLINQAQSSMSTESLAADETNFRFYFTTNREGLVAFGKQYGDHINYLSAKDNITAFYYLGAGLKPNQLWHVIWPEYLYRWNVPGMIMLENRETGDLLCINRNNMEQSSESARNYYENNFILLNAKDNMLNPQCSWKFKKFNIL